MVYQRPRRSAYLLPLPSSHPILVEPQEAETKRLAVQGSIPEDRPALGCWAGQRQGPKQNFQIEAISLFRTVGSVWSWPESAASRTELLPPHCLRAHNSIPRTFWGPSSQKLSALAAADSVVLRGSFSSAGFVRTRDSLLDTCPVQKILGQGQAVRPG